MREFHPVSGTDRLKRLADELDQAGRPYAIATVVRRRPPVSAQVGDKALITADGQLFGWIGGSCSQSVVRREAVAAIRTGRPRLLRLTADEAELAESDPGVTTLPMTCPSGGQVEIYIEPQLQRPRLVAVGATPVVRALGLLAPVVGFDVTLVTEKDEELDLPVEWARRMRLDEFNTAAFPETTFFVVASAGHYDEEALLRALQTNSSYIALVASRRRSQAVMEVLRAHGCPEEQLARIRTPAGFDIKAATQEEIALSVLTEIVAHYRQGLTSARSQGPGDTDAASGARKEGGASAMGVESGAASVTGVDGGAGSAGVAAAGGPERPAADAGATADDRPAAPPAGDGVDLSLPIAVPALARDPVCGMEVEIANARHTAEYGGQTYYFCCPHCRMRFLKNPEQYLAEATP